MFSVAIGWSILFIAAIFVIIIGLLLNIPWKAKIMIIITLLLVGGPGLQNLSSSYQEFREFTSGNQTSFELVRDEGKIVLNSFRTWDNLTYMGAKSSKEIEQVLQDENITTSEFSKFLMQQSWFFPLSVEIAIILLFFWTFGFIIKAILGKSEDAQKHRNTVKLIAFILAIVTTAIMSWGFKGIIAVFDLFLG